MLVDDRKMKLVGLERQIHSFLFSFPFPVKGIRPPRHQEIHTFNTYRKVKFFHLKFTMKLKVTEVQVTILTHYHKIGCWILNK